MMWYNIFYILHDNLYSVLWARSGRMRGGSILGLGLRLSLGLVRGLGLYYLLVRGLVCFGLT